MALYSDINQTTPETTPLLFDLDSVKQSISNIIETFDGTRLFRPELNSHMEDLLHEPFDELTEFQLRTELATAVETFEPRVIVNEIVVEDYPDEGRYEVKLHFLVRGLEGRQFEQVTTIER